MTIIEIESLGDSGNTLDMAIGQSVTITFPPCPICDHRSGGGPCVSCKPNGRTCLPCYYRGPVPANEPPPPIAMP
jgi:hypothetical protein